MTAPLDPPREPRVSDEILDSLFDHPGYIRSLALDLRDARARLAAVDQERDAARTNGAGLLRLMEERAERLRALLKTTEWIEYPGHKVRLCPECGEKESYGHEIGCQIGAALAESSPPTTTTGEGA